MSPRAPRRVWITGLGMITASGIGRDAFWSGLHEARSPVKRIDRFDPSPFRSQVAAQVDKFDATNFMDARTASRMDRFSQFSVVAGLLAMADAGIELGSPGTARADRFAVYVGSALGGIAYAEEQHVRYMERGIKSVAPNLALAVFGGAAPANLGIFLGLHGPVLSTGKLVRGRCGRAGRGIPLDTLGRSRRGPCRRRGDPVIAACLRRLRHHPGALGRSQRSTDGGMPAIRCRARRLRHGRGCGPAGARGRRSCRARGATPYAELRGFAATSDAFHMVQPRPDGLQAARAARLALADGRSAPPTSTTSMRMPPPRRWATPRKPSPCARHWPPARPRSQFPARRLTTVIRLEHRVRSRQRSVPSPSSAAGRPAR